jgi:hypothetical protein
VLAGPTTIDDSGVRAFTQGYSYSGYGDLYLDQLRQATVPEPAGGLTTLAISGMLLMRRNKARSTSMPDLLTGGVP